MALSERRIRYETLIRWHEDGTIGAQQIDLDQVLRDGVVISSTLTPAMQLGTADYPGATPLGDILGEAASTAFVRVEVLEKSLGEVSTIAQQQIEQLTQARSELSTLRSDLATAQQTIADLQTQLAQGPAEEGPAEAEAVTDPAA
jgi:hypothetical protein